MKRQFHSSSPPSSPLSNSQISDELEPVPKRPRIFVSSPTPPPDHNDDEEDEIEVIFDEPLIPSVTITEDSQSEHESEEDERDTTDDDDDDIIEIEQQNLDFFLQQNDNAVIIVSDSDSDDDQGIDVTDDILPSVSSITNESTSSPDIADVEIVREELTLMDDEEDEAQQQTNIEDDHEPLEIVANDDENNNLNINNELIDLTDDEPISFTSSSISSERKLSVDVQQCPICLETLSHLQRSGVYLIITRCRHVMCTLCSRQLLATSSRCPLCRENVSSTTLVPYCILT